MSVNFDKVIDRRKTRSLKWDTGADDVLPMWVADMDFEIAAPIKEALSQRIQHGVLGYSIQDETYYEAIKRWMRKRHQWTVENQWISHAPGIVPALHFIAQAFLRPGERIMMHAPVYYPFFGSARKNNIEVEFSRLLYQDGRYEINFDEFEAIAAKKEVKVFYLCSPHNPGGRVWQYEELERMASICYEHGVMVVADEIHADLIYPGISFTAYGQLPQKYQNQVIVCIAPSKTFNLAGLQTSCLIIPNPEIKQIYDDFVDRLGIMRPGIFGIIGMVAAFTEGEPWLEQLMIYLKQNYETLEQYCAAHLPKIKLMKPDATYLIWMDVSGYLTELGMSHEELHQRLIDVGKVWLDEGYMFGDSGRGFERINIACPKATLLEALEGMRKALCG